MEEINIKDFLEYLKKYVLLILAVVAVALVIADRQSLRSG